MEHGGWRAAGTEPQAVDVDRHLADLAPEGVPDRVPDGRIDLARDLRHGNAEGDGEIEVDVERGAEADVDPGLGEPERSSRRSWGRPANPVTP